MAITSKERMTGWSGQKKIELWKLELMKLNSGKP